MSWPRWEVRVEQDFMRRSWNVLMRRGGLYKEGIPDEFINVTMVPLSEEHEGMSREAFYEKYHPLELNESAAQQLMDELWKAGFKPSDAMGSAGSMAAAQEHLRSVEDTKNRLLALVEKAWEWGREK